MISYTTVVNNLIAAANNVVTVNTAGFGSLDKLDANFQNGQFPYVFFRPLSSPGITFNFQMAGPRILTFEMYVLDLPKLTDADFLDVMSNCEQIGYNIITQFYDGSYEDVMTVQVTSITPVNEAFQDRCGGHVFTMNVITDSSGITTCNVPQ